MIVCASTSAVGISLNYIVDVEGLYRRAERSIFFDYYARNLVKSHRGLVTAAPDRSVKLRLASVSESDCYVIGSSHEAQIDIETMPALAGKCRRVTNLAVSGASFEDILALSRSVATNPSARRIFIGLGPWSFRADADERWKQERDAYMDARRYFGLPISGDATFGSLAELENLLNGAYLWRNLEEIWRRKAIGRTDPTVVVVDENHTVADNEAIYLPTGRLIYSRNFLNRVPLPEGRIGDGSYKIAAPIIDAGTIAEFERLIGLLKARNLTVDFILMPYHPKVMKCQNHVVCAALRDVENKVKELSNRNGLKIVGSFDPRPFGLAAGDFYDDMHVAMGSIFKVSALN